MDILLYPCVTIIILAHAELVSGIHSYTNCVKPGKHLDGCTSTSNRIFVGEQVTKGAIPWQVLLRLSSDNSYFGACGGTIISHQFVLTAAHCFIYPTGVNKSWNIKLDISYIMSGSTKFDNGQRHAIKKLIVHPGYAWKLISNLGFLLTNDVAIVKVSPSFVYGENVKALCLAKVGLSIPEGSTLTVSGWGIMEYSRINNGLPEFSQTLMRTELKTISFRRGKCRYNKYYRHNKYAKICTYNPPHDSCNGDSGGPITMAVDGQCVLVGIVSEGGICGSVDYGALIVNVSFYRTWILKQIEESRVLFFPNFLTDTFKLI
ncbi:venom peptide isomerase heavy chain isoform X2 [Lepeophtheirus salmonis]|uniref:venom peptide isomerase heavy chain isoform X2 n=1 Tax=Lepeophtheirus salmonis TaxID=72036 RepID=UPI003AF3AF4B